MLTAIKKNTFEEKILSRGKKILLNGLRASHPVIVLENDAKEDESEDVEDGGQAANVTDRQQFVRRPRNFYYFRDVAKRQDFVRLHD